MHSSAGCDGPQLGNQRIDFKFCLAFGKVILLLLTAAAAAAATELATTTNWMASGSHEAVAKEARGGSLGVFGRGVGASSSGAADFLFDFCCFLLRAAQPFTNESGRGLQCGMPEPASQGPAVLGVPPY